MESAPSEHTRAMARALERAASRGGWLATPEVAVDYRGPVDVCFLPFGDAGRDRPALATLASVVARQPGREACEDAERSLSFAELWRAVGHLAAAIRDSGLDGPVGILLGNRVDYPVAVLACLAAGRISVLLDASFPESRNEALLRLTGVRLVIAAGDDGANLGVARLPIAAAFTSGEPAAAPDPAALGLDETAFVLCTSGSTGEPKAIAYSQRGVLHQVRALIDALHLSERDRFLLVTSGAAIAGLFSLFTMLSGCTLHLLPLSRLGFGGLRRALTTRPVTVLRASPSLLRSIAVLPGAREMLAGLRAVRASGEPLLRADVEMLSRLLPTGCVILNGYGSTEVPGAAWFCRPEDQQDPVRTAAGVLDPETEAMIVDVDGQPCPPGETGELLIRSRYAALGEWREGGLTAGRLVPDPADPGLRIYRTGDLARLTPDGAFVVLGRMDRMVKVNGQRVELAEVETELRRSPEVAQAAVVADTRAGRVILRAFVVATDGCADGLAGRLREATRRALPGFMQPGTIEVLKGLPLLPGGKLDERGLLALGV